MGRQAIVVAAGAVAVIAVVVGTLAFTGPSSDSSGGMMTMADGQTMASSDMPTSEEPAAAPFDRGFIDAMVPHHESAIAMARTALAAGLKEPELRSIAQAIVSTQQDEIDRMLDWRVQWYGSAEIDPNADAQLGMSMADMGMEGDASELDGSPDVDADFASMMIAHHEGAVAMANMALERSQRDEIRTLARAIVAAQEDEIARMEPFAG